MDTVAKMHLPMQLMLLVGLAWSRASAQNPFEQMAAGALLVGSEIMNTLQEGTAAKHQTNFETGVVNVRSKSSMGYGDAMRPANNDDSSESDERRRRRSITNNNNNKKSNSIISLHQAMHRIRRSPCFMMMTTMMPPDVDDVEARKRRARKRAASTAAKKRKTKAKKKKMIEALQRERRQALTQPMEPEQSPFMVGDIGERVKGFWLTVMNNMGDVMQQMGQKIKGVAAQGAAAQQQQ